MTKYKDTIDEGYSEYLKKYPEAQIVSVGDYDYPLQGAALDDQMWNINIRTNSPLSREYLVEKRSDLPSISELPMDDLAWLPVGLMRLMKIEQTIDHEEVWKEAAYTIDIMSSSNHPFQDSIVENIETLVRAGLCSVTPQIQPRADKWSKEANEAHLLKRSKVIARFMAFPTLEGMLKCLLQQDIKMDGEVRSGRQISSYSGEDYSDGDVVNDLGHLLWHFEQNWADDTLQNRLQQSRVAIEEFFQLEPNSSLGYLSNQRNIALHGERRSKAELGLILNLISLLILNVDHITSKESI